MRRSPTTAAIPKGNDSDFINARPLKNAGIAAKMADQCADIFSARLTVDQHGQDRGPTCARDWGCRTACHEIRRCPLARSRAVLLESARRAVGPSRYFLMKSATMSVTGLPDLFSGMCSTSRPLVTTSPAFFWTEAAPLRVSVSVPLRT